MINQYIPGYIVDGNEVVVLTAQISKTRASPPEAIQGHTQDDLFWERRGVYFFLGDAVDFLNCRFVLWKIQPV